MESGREEHEISCDAYQLSMGTRCGSANVWRDELARVLQPDVLGDEFDQVIRARAYLAHLWVLAPLFFGAVFFLLFVAPGRGISSVGLTFSSPRAASLNGSGMWTLSPGCGTPVVWPIFFTASYPVFEVSSGFAALSCR
jgi:hypothetical protein